MRHSRPEVLYEGGLLKYFAKLKEKKPVLEYLFEKFASLKASNFTKKKLQLGVFL